MSRAAIAGDIVGSRFERSLWQGATLADAVCVGAEGVEGDEALDCRGETANFDLFHADCFATDDSILTVATMDWLLNGGEARDFLRAHFRRAPCPELFGRYFRAWAASDGDEPCGSIGNGAAMRIAPVAYAAQSLDEACQMAHQNAWATHQTPDALAGARAIAAGVWLARNGADKARIEREVAQESGYDLSRTLDEWRPGYRFTSACEQTVPIAFRAFFETRDWEGAVRAAVTLGGDSDTIASMAGALAGAATGLPSWAAQRVEAMLDAQSREVLLRWEQHFGFQV